MRRRIRIKSKQVSFLLILALAFGDLKAGGISVDAGITPGQDRFILRSQYRFMSMENDMMTRYTRMVPLVLAYGVTSGITVLARGMYVHHKASDNNEIEHGINDPFILAKFRLYRKNTENYVLGIAPHIASNLPIGSLEISDRTWNPELGLNISYRPRFFSLDISASYILSDVTKKLAVKPGNIFSLNTAFSGLIPLKTRTSSALSPVIELTYSSQSPGGVIPKRDILFVSPGVSFIYANLALEALVQLPIFQEGNMSMMDQNPRLILGLKFMF
jgi:hypothetical protein